jgi:hypothetical protein
MFVSCIDSDPVAANMAFIQLSLLGIAAEVFTGNTLTREFNRVRYTPVYYLNDFEERLESQHRIKAMLACSPRTKQRGTALQGSQDYGFLWDA